MATLTNNQINQTYDSLLKLEDNDGLSGTKKTITDGLGNDTPLSISDTEVASTVNIEASGFKTPTGTSSQLLAANGTVVDSSTIGGGTIDGSGTTNKVAKWSDADTIDDSIIYDDGANIGINTTSTTNFGTGSTIVTTAAKAGGYYAGSINKTANVESQMYSDENGNVYLGARSNHPLLLTVNNTEMARVTTSGNVGIGTTSPSEALHVSGNVRATGNFIGSNAYWGATYGNKGTDKGIRFEAPATAVQTARVDADALSLNFGGSGGSGENFRLEETGELKLNQYGSGTITGTAAKMLAVDTSGNVIEEDMPSGGGGSLFGSQIMSGAFYHSTNTIGDVYWIDMPYINELTSNPNYDNNWAPYADGRFKFIQVVHNQFGSAPSAYGMRFYYKKNTASSGGTETLIGTATITNSAANGMTAVYELSDSELTFTFGESIAIGFTTLVAGAQTGKFFGGWWNIGVEYT